jgi:2-haloacid dehalogenase
MSAAVPASAKTPRTVVFDLGGVLIDWNPRYHFHEIFAGDVAAMERFLGEVCTQHWNERQDEGRTIAEAEAELIARHPHEAERIRQYYAGFGRMMRCEIAGSVAILEELAAAGIPLYALTNWSAETFPLATRRFPFFKHFRGVVVSGEVKTMKPRRRIFELLLERHGLAAADCVFIDDAEKNAIGAREAGLHAIHFRSPEQLRRELVALGLPVRAAP